MSNSTKDDLNTALRNSAGYLLSQASRLLRAEVSAALAPLRLSLNEFIILRLVSRKLPISQGSLAETYGIDPSTMVSLIDHLEELQLLTRERDRLDRRRYNLVLTPKGAKVSAQGKRLAEKAQRKFLQPVTDDEWETVREVLCRLVFR